MGQEAKNCKTAGQSKLIQKYCNPAPLYFQLNEELLVLPAPTMSQLGILRFIWLGHREVNFWKVVFDELVLASGKPIGGGHSLELRSVGTSGFGELGEWLLLG